MLFYTHCGDVTCENLHKLIKKGFACWNFYSLCLNQKICLPCHFLILLSLCEWVTRSWSGRPAWSLQTRLDSRHSQHCHRTAPFHNGHSLSPLHPTLSHRTAGSATLRCRHQVKRSVYSILQNRHSAESKGCQQLNDITNYFTSFWIKVSANVDLTKIEISCHTTISCKTSWCHIPTFIKLVTCDVWINQNS